MLSAGLNYISLLARLPFLNFKIAAITAKSPGIESYGNIKKHTSFVIQRGNKLFITNLTKTGYYQNVVDSNAINIR